MGYKLLGVARYMVFFISACSFNKYLLCAHYVADSALGTEVTEMNKTKSLLSDSILPSAGNYSFLQNERVSSSIR